MKPGAPAGVRPADIDPRSPAFVDDPYPTYARLREAGPIHFVPASGAHWVMRHADALQVMADPRCIKGTLPLMNNAPGPLASLALRLASRRYARLLALPRNFLRLDPPEHTRLRALVQGAFTPPVVEALRPRVEALCRELLDRMAPRGEADLAVEFCFPLPARVIAELLGVPAEDQDRFRTWSDRMVLNLDPTQPRAVHRAAMAAGAELAEYCAALVAERRARPRSDLISRLIAAEDEGRRLGEGDVISTCILLLVAGHETTANLIGGGIMALLAHPEQLERLRRQPEAMPAAVEELLRFVTPVQMIRRAMREDGELAGAPLRRGDNVLAVVAAANRDPAVFNDPEGLDLSRAHNPHLAFARGTHFCLGAPLARLEAQIAFAHLLERLPGLRLGDRPPVRSGNTAVRGVVSLPVRW